MWYTFSSEQMLLVESLLHKLPLNICSICASLASHFGYFRLLKVVLVVFPVTSIDSLWSSPKERKKSSERSNLARAKYVLVWWDKTPISTEFCGGYLHFWRGVSSKRLCLHIWPILAIASLNVAVLQPGVLCWNLLIQMRNCWVVKIELQAA